MKIDIKLLSRNYEDLDGLLTEIKTFYRQGYKLNGGITLNNVALSEGYQLQYHATVVKESDDSLYNSD